MPELEREIASLRSSIDSLRHSHEILVDGGDWVDQIEDHLLNDQGLAPAEVEFSDVEAAARALGVI